MKYYVFDLDDEDFVGEGFDTIEQAEELLCLLAGIKKSQIDKYLASNDCQYEIRADDDDDEGD